jgi:hypothetical protein
MSRSCPEWARRDGCAPGGGCAPPMVPPYRVSTRFRQLLRLWADSRATPGRVARTYEFFTTFLKPLSQLAFRFVGTNSLLPSHAIEPGSKSQFPMDLQHPCPDRRREAQAHAEPERET